jgi:hypothetical protein
LNRPWFTGSSILREYRGVETAEGRPLRVGFLGFRPGWLPSYLSQSRPRPSPGAAGASRTGGVARHGRHTERDDLALRTMRAATAPASTTVSSITPRDEKAGTSEAFERLDEITTVAGRVADSVKPFVASAKSVSV